MSVTMFVAAVLSQTTASMVVMPTEPVIPAAGFEELAQGKPNEAIERIRIDRSLNDNPVALINVGTAHARLGDVEQARLSYRAAMVSKQRYDVELADGRVMDSREAARLALGRLDFASR